MPTDKKSNKDFVEHKTSSLLARLKDTYIIVSKKEVRSWHGFMVLGFLSGFTAALFFSVSQDLSEKIFAVIPPAITNQASVSYQGADLASYGPTASNSVTITITAAAPLNNAPVAQPQSVSVAEDTAKSITTVATDADGDPLTYSMVTSPTYGTLSGNVPNLTYTPSANYNGADSFTFKSNDGKVDSNTATVSITVTAVNDAPVARAGLNQTVASGSIVALDGSGSMDPDGDSLTYQWVQTAGTTVTLSGATTVKPTFTAPTVNTATALTFQLTVMDGSLSSNAIVTITVNPPADTTLPTVSLTAPLNGATVAVKSVVTLSASAVDNVGVAKVQFFINGKLLSTDLSAPYSASWKVPAVRGRAYKIQATATDKAGNVGRSAIITVTAK